MKLYRKGDEAILALGFPILCSFVGWLFAKGFIWFFEWFKNT